MSRNKNSWIGTPDPPDTSAPLHPEGRKRYDPRAPSSGAPPKPVPAPPGLGITSGSDGDCSNGLPLHQLPIDVGGTAEPGATVVVYIYDPLVTTQQVATTTAAADGSWTAHITRLPEGRNCLVAKQHVANGPSSEFSAQTCLMVGTCVEKVAPVPPAIGGHTNQGTPCGDTVALENPVTLYGTGIPGATVDLFLSEGPYAGSKPGTALVGADGTWTSHLRHLPDGRQCVVAVQHIDGGEPSDLSPEHCFVVGECVEGPPPEQIVDTQTNLLRFSPDRGWEHGTLALKINGEWTYGVLRTVGSGREM